MNMADNPRIRRVLCGICVPPSSHLTVWSTGSSIAPCRVEILSPARWNIPPPPGGTFLHPRRSASRRVGAITRRPRARQGDPVLAIGDPQLLVQMVDMRLHRGWGDAQPGGDPGVGQTLGEQA